MNEFEKLGLNLKILKAISHLGFKEPTEIQKKTIPPILEGKDVVGQSATGSGKTLAFGCGILEQVIAKKGLQALVLTPTRELAQQVKKDLDALSYDQTLRIALVYGGVSLSPQIDALKRAEIVVATPGRLLDHLNRKTVKLDKISILVLDEADRMLDMGFIDDVEQIIKNCGFERQTLLFSATIPSRIKALAKKYMKNPLNLSAKKFVDHSKLKQEYYNVQREIKPSLLAYLLEKENFKLAMIFCNTRKTVDYVARKLRSAKINAIGIHGGISQYMRNKALTSFRKSQQGVLVCTDVAARGLHIDNVSHIYNYDLPQNPIDYIHRIGRTARAGKKGKVINLLCQRDHENFRKILKNFSHFKIQKENTPHVKKIKAEYHIKKNYSNIQRKIRTQNNLRFRKIKE